MTGPTRIAVVGLGAILPDAPDVDSFWRHLEAGLSSIGDVPPGRWDPALYYDPDPLAEDKTYSRIGGWVTGFDWDPLAWKLPIPPKVAAAMDDAQKWAIACARQALLDYGWPDRPLDRERTAVIIGNALAGEKHYQTALRISFPEFVRQLEASPTFDALDKEAREAIIAEAHAGARLLAPDITEDTMPGELANILAGRVANLFDLKGPNFVCDAACASGMAAMSAAVQGLALGEFDAALTGGIDRNMNVSAFVKFCKIGALSATGSRPYGDGADGFVMGEGAALFLLKRLEDAERDGDRIYAVLLGVGGSSDGRGKGITAPNPVGQRLAVERAWARAGVDPATATYVEGHGTSTKVGDVVEVEALASVFGADGLAPGSIALGSVKSNIGHLKGAAGAVGVLKAVLALHHKVLPPSLNAEQPNPNIDFGATPFAVNTEGRPWPEAPLGVRRAGVSAFGFGGTNFHVVLEEHGSEPRRRTTVGRTETSEPAPRSHGVVVGAADDAAVAGRLRELASDAEAQAASAPMPPSDVDLAAPVRVAIEFADAGELTDKAAKAADAIESGAPAAAWRALRAKGIYMGRGPAAKIAYLYTGQGSQYVNMLRELRSAELVVADTFAQADVVMTPLLGRPLTEFIFSDEVDDDTRARMEQQLLQTEITQPAVLATDISLTRLLAAHGVQPDMVMGHSLGEYGALVAAGSLTFEAALEAVSARGQEMAHLTVEDNGLMAAVMAPLEEIERIVAAIDGNVVVANVNSTKQAVIGGATAAVEEAVAQCQAAGHTVVLLPVSHAFHTSIVAPASEPLRDVLVRLDLRAPSVPIVANVTGDFYPTGPGAREEMLGLLARQVASPVQFVAGLRALYAAGARVFVEVGPKRALQGFAEDVLAAHDDVVTLCTNHPKQGDVVSFDRALCALWAAGHGGTRAAPTTATAHTPHTTGAPMPVDASEPVVITGAALGLPGVPRVFDDANVGRILSGQQFISAIPDALRERMLAKRVTRLVKRESGDPTFEAIDDVADVIKLAARAGDVDLEHDFGVDPDRVAALDVVTKLAIGAGLDALRDAGIPLVQRYRETTLGTRLPIGWALPDELRDDTGVIFASAFPGLDALASDLERFFTDRARRQELANLESLRAAVREPAAVAALDQRLAGLRDAIAAEPFEFDRRFLFRVLAMGHSQFAELIGARGPNTQVNAACAGTTQAVSLAEDWIRAGRARRVIVVAGDDVTSDHLLEWIGAGFLASGAAATDEAVEDAALPFDNRRHGMLLGMGAAALVVETPASARERGLQPICEVLGAVTANSAFHGTRLDVDHITGVMETLVRQAEARGVDRHEMAPELVFVSHETYTPARGGSAAAEVNALRTVFGDEDADRIVVANTKGFTGHPMGVGIEDVVAVKALETGVVPPVANFRDVDPSLGRLRLSDGGDYPVWYALRLAAGFGSQISMVLLRWTPVPDGRRRSPEELGYAYRIVDDEAWRAWLRRVSGQGDPMLEVVQRRLRIAAPAAAPSVAEPEPAPVPVAEPEPVAPVATAIDPTEAILAVVADKTGYPTDLLDLDLDLEADLGIDTVKQAEVFAAIRETFAIPRDDNLKLRDYPTLDHVISFVRERTGPTPAVERVVPVATAIDPTEAILAVVADKTGYPTDLLDLDLDLEADLGIDTVKQAEVFAAIREAFAIPRDDNLKLRDYPTLDHVISFVRERVAASPAAAPADAPAPADAVAATPAEPVAVLPITTIAGSIEAAEVIPRRVPVAVLRPPLEWCKPTGATLGAGTRAVVMADTGRVADALASELIARGATPLVVAGFPAAEDLVALLDRWTEDGPIHGVYWLPALDSEGDLSTLDLSTWKEATRRRVKLLYATMRHLDAHVGAAGTFLVTATRMGGRHGYDDAGAENPLGGAVTGFTKAFKRERAGAVVKAVDVETGAEPRDVARALVEETLRDPGAVEIGRRGTRRWTVSLREQRAADGTPAVALSPDDVFVVTGAAGSIVSAITADLAGAAGGGAFHLLDLSPEPDPTDPDLRRFVEDRDALKLEIAEHLRAAGERPTPVLIERRLAQLERKAAALGAIQAIRAAGGTATYHALDLTDAEAVAAAVDGIRQAHGRIDVLVHAAGLEISHLLADKQPAEFDLVFDVKSDGWFNVLRAAGDMPIRTAVAFSSVAGRFGNGGQTDYSAANDLLCKFVSSFRTTRPTTRAIAIDWTAWGGIGMATRGSIPKMMELAGIDMLPPDAGVATVRRELVAGSWGGEVVVGQRLGVLTDELDPDGGIDADAVPPAMVGPMVARVSGAPLHRGLVVVSALHPDAQAFLHDHRIDGTPVLPGVMGVEAFAEVASLLAGGAHVAAIEDIDFAAPFKFYRGEPRQVTVEAQFVADGDDVVVSCRLLGHRTLPGNDVPQETVHFTGSVRLSDDTTPVTSTPVPPPTRAGDPTVAAEAIYDVYFHGPAYQVLARAWQDGDAVVGELAHDLPADHAPAAVQLVTDPRLLELCFQTAGVGELGRQHRFALPNHVDRVRFLCPPAATHDDVVWAIVRTAGDGFDAQVVDARGHVVVELAGYRTVELPGGIDAQRLAPLSAAMT